MPAGSKYQTFVDSKRVIRAHPDWSDQQVLDELRLPSFCLPEVQEARKDLRAVTECPRTDFTPGNPGLDAMRDAAAGGA
jgi:hypothetical protein